MQEQEVFMAQMTNKYNTDQSASVSFDTITAETPRPRQKYMPCNNFALNTNKKYGFNFEESNIF